MVCIVHAQRVCTIIIVVVRQLGYVTVEFVCGSWQLSMQGTLSRTGTYTSLTVLECSGIFFYSFTLN